MVQHFGTPQTLAGEPGPARTALSAVATALFAGGLLLACTPTVRVEAPKEPIRIDLNITADVRIKVERAVDDAIVSNPDIF